MPGVHVRGTGKSDRPEKLQTQQPVLNVPGSYWLSHKQNIYKFTFKYHEPTRDTKEFLYEDELMKVIRHIIKCQPSQGQLSTLHLSITYKHTFWTRQDKMFAMLKFRNRQTAAVYPQAFILTISVVDNPEIQINGVIIKADPNLDCKDSSLKQPLQNSPNLTNTEASDENVPRQTEDNKNFTKLFKQLNSQQNPSSPTTTATDTTVICQKSLSIADSDKSTAHTTTEWTSQEIFNAVPHSEWYEPSNNPATANLDRSTQEKEIGERGIDSEPITPRSSNITDQVMEGLMFTIKQVEDNVKVVEQRTKMELDEVLENSEKVETKEGERCLVNSSLLRLENLVTKIEIPDKQLKDSKIIDAASVINSLTLLSEYSVLDFNGFSTAGCLADRPVIQQQEDILVDRTSQSLPRNSLESNWDNRTNDPVLKKFFPPSDELSPIKLADVKLADRGDNITKEFHQNLRRQKKRKFVPQELNIRDFKKSVAIENRNAEEHNNSSSSGSDDNDNDDDDDNNNNNNINATGEVQIDMWKLLQDITRGAKVMVERISDIDIRNATRSSTISVSATRDTGRRILTRRKK